LRHRASDASVASAAFRGLQVLTPPEHEAQGADRIITSAIDARPRRAAQGRRGRPGRSPRPRRL